MEVNSISTRVEHSFQKAMWRAIMQRTHDEMISYLDELYSRFERSPIHDVDCAEEADAGFGAGVPVDELRRYEPLFPFIGCATSLPLNGAEHLLEMSLKKRLVTKKRILCMIRNCGAIYRTNKAATQSGS